MKARFSGKAALAAAALSVGLLPSLAEAQVFRAAGDSLSLERHQQLQADPLAVPDRWRLARLDLGEIADAADSDMPLVFNLFDDVEVRGHVQGTKSLSGGSSFVSGSLEDGGHFTIFFHGSGIVRGKIDSPHGFYSLRSEGEDFSQVLIKQEDVPELRGCGVEQPPAAGEVPAITARPFESMGNVARGRWTGSAHAVRRGDEETSKISDVLVVLVLYSQVLEDHEGGPEHVKATIEAKMAEMNQILDNSGLSHRQMRLAMAKVDLGEGERLESILSEENSDALHDLREEHQADLVHLVVEYPTGPTGCGWASIGYGDGYEYWAQRNCESADNNALCVTNHRRWRWNGVSASRIGCSWIVFPHEIGHTMGIHHDRDASLYEDGDTPYYGHTLRKDRYLRGHTGNPGHAPARYQPLNYAFGYNGPKSRECRFGGQGTIMAYPPRCGVAGYSWVPHFSNPDVLFPPPPPQYAGGLTHERYTPTGVPGDERTVDLDGPADASRTIDEVWDIVAGISELAGLPFCEEGDISADALSSLSEEVAFPAQGADREFVISFAAPDKCADINLQTHSSLSAFSASVEWLRQGEYLLSINADLHNGPCGSGPRTGVVAASLNGPPDVSPLTISIQQGFHNEFCGGLSGAPEEAVFLDLSGRNPYSGFRLSSGMFAGFPRLEDLNLSDNLLDHFQNSYFDGLNLLKRLDLSGNELTELEDAAFAHLPELEHLNLQGNKLRRIKDSYFDKAVWERDAARYRALRTLDLSHNELKELDERSFRHFEYLESLQLNDNQLEAIDKDSFLGPSGLKQLNLARNSIEAVARFAFIFTTELTHLNLSSNRIASLSDGTFGRVWHDGTVNALEDLRQLNLSRNRLEEFPELSMNGKLTHLWLGWNRIASVGDGLSEQAELTGLQLSSNRLAEFPDLSGNGKLTRLWLGGNAIAAVGDGLSHLPELTALQLSRNQLEEMPDLSNNRKLTHLWLEGNKVASIPPRAFAGLSELRYLNISNNPLTEPLPAAVCTFIRGVKTVVAEGIDMSVVCPP